MTSRPPAGAAGNPQHPELERRIAKKVVRRSVWLYMAVLALGVAVTLVTFCLPVKQPPAKQSLGTGTAPGEDTRPPRALASSPATPRSASTPDAGPAKSPLLRGYLRAGALDVLGPNASSLTGDQLEKCVQALETMTEARLRYEASIAQADSVSPTEVLVTIPAYKEEGARLYSELEGALRSIVGPERADALLTDCNYRLAMASADFGRSEQHILINNTDYGYKVVHDSEIEWAPGGSPSEPPPTSRYTTGATLSRDDLSAYAYLAHFFP